MRTLCCAEQDPIEARIRLRSNAFEGLRDNIRHAKALNLLRTSMAVQAVTQGL